MNLMEYYYLALYIYSLYLSPKKYLKYLMSLIFHYFKTKNKVIHILTDLIFSSFIKSKIILLNYQQIKYL
jgi:hypothetical protein